MVSEIKIRIDFCFFIAKNVVPIEDILEMCGVDNMLNEVERYNARIWRHYIAWYIKICLGDLNEVKNGITWLKYFNQGCHNMAKGGIFKISNRKIVPK